jgi:2,4-dienoyl-CoA reductase-like NADH-dependent reductase (Old Yellow Enzyme family)
MPHLMSPFKLRQLEFKNRIFVSPMCQYSATSGVPNDWHLVHLGSRAVGGAALVICEATAVSPEGRISLNDLGLWNDEQEKAFLHINQFIKNQGSISGIQIAHAGRKSEAFNKPDAYSPLAPSAIAFSEKYNLPQEMSEKKIADVLKQFIQSTHRSLNAGFEVIEIHMAHGYLFHEFLSPISNQRKDSYGGCFENRIRFPLQVAKAVRAIWPQNLPVFVRISATDWIEPEGWTLKDSIEFSKQLKKIGIDFIDCSTGGNVTHAQIPVAPNYQVRFAETIKKEVQIATGAVGLITEPEQADQIISSHQADAVLLARELLRDPYWPLHAAQKLKQEIPWPTQYVRAKN